jgi:hypothetical protein
MKCAQKWFNRMFDAQDDYEWNVQNMEESLVYIKVFSIA